MEPSEVRDLVHHGREERNLEYKGPVAWAETEVKARLTKGALALSNTRDGGFIVIGVEQVEESFNPVGLSQEQLNSFSQDDVAAHMNSFLLSSAPAHETDATERRPHKRVDKNEATPA